MLDVLVQPRRNAKAASRFLRGLLARFGTPRVIITDKLHRYIKPIHTLVHRAQKVPAAHDQII
ncbi:MAG: IS6 family transposase [Mesorhizobium sp.]|nr:MAG: IS6 family transposase [Mesorhizobium sp.]TJU83297.1 MAG: IS6 family transposase [Mesorhizobium sp.]